MIKLFQTLVRLWRNLIHCSRLVKCECSTFPLCLFWPFYFPVYQVEYAYFVIHQQGVGLSNRRGICILNWCHSNDNVSNLSEWNLMEILLAHGDKRFCMVLNASWCVFFLIDCGFVFRHILSLHLNIKLWPICYSVDYLMGNGNIYLCM